jgi:hypothetical protein
LQHEFDFSQLRGLCNEIIQEDEVKSKTEKVDFAICYLDEMRVRLQSLRDSIMQEAQQADE